MTKNITKNILLEHKNRLSLLNNYSFIRDVENGILFFDAVFNPTFQNINDEACKVTRISIENQEHLFFVKELIWDSKFNGFPCFSIELILFSHDKLKILQIALRTFCELYLQPNSYYTINVPSEDLLLVQALSCTNFILVETRLNYFLNLKNSIEKNHSESIKIADYKDIPNLRSIAYRMRNRFDRVHADPTFSDEFADQYLARFAEESVKGFADLVLKVVDKNDILFGFLTSTYPKSIAGFNISKLGLAAIDSSIQKGCLFDLVSETIFQLKLKKTDYLSVITQAANIPAIRTWEKAGFSLFKVTYLYSKKND